MRIITGTLGEDHVTSNDDGEFNMALFGSGMVVLENGHKFDASIISSNKIEVKDGNLVMQGRHALINPNEVEDINIETGNVGYKRNDLIVARYTLNPETGYEDISLKVIKGQETTGTPVDPSYITGDIRTGATLVEYPLYRVAVNVTAQTLTKLFEVNEIGKDAFIAWLKA